jgi:acetolactate synthase-1/2/3 large subunit
MPIVKAAQAIVEVLKAEGVKFIFGLPGGHTIPIYDALYDAPEIRHILVRHEQAAANMAGGYAILTGEPGVCCATAGPGATNLATGIAEAFMGALPVIILTGRGATRNSLRGEAQEIPQDKIFAPITKWAIRVDRSDMVVDVMRRAFSIVRSGKPGPVLIDLPVDVLMQPVQFDGYIPVGKPPTPRGNIELVRAAVDELLHSKRPIVIVGGGTVMSGAFNELREFAETLGLPVLTTLSGRGSFPDDHPLAGGGLGLHQTGVSKRLLTEADFVLGLGFRFEEMETVWTPEYLPAPDACYVQVDVDPTEIGKSVVPKIGIISDIKLLLEDMLKVAREKAGPDHRNTFHNLPRIKELFQVKEQLQAELKRAIAKDDVPMSPLRVIMEIGDALPRETTRGIDIGLIASALGGTFPYFKVYEPRSILACTSFYAMGFAASAIPVAKLVYPERPAVVLCGDGTFQMIMNILPVAVDHHLPVTWCVVDNHCLGSLKPPPGEDSKGRYIPIPGNFQTQLDFVLIAQASKCYGEKVEDPRQIKPAIGRALEVNKQGTPAVLDFIVRWEWPQCGFDIWGTALSTKEHG